MPFLIRVDTDTGVAIADCSGVLQLEESLDAVEHLWKTPGWPGKLAVWDLQAASFDLSVSDVMHMASFILENQPANPEKIAFVVSSDVGYGLARMFGAYRDDAKTSFQSFRDFDEAWLWLIKKEADVTG